MAVSRRSRVTVPCNDASNPSTCSRVSSAPRPMRTARASSGGTPDGTDTCDGSGLALEQAAPLDRIPSPIELANQCFAVDIRQREVRRIRQRSVPRPNSTAPMSRKPNSSSSRRTRTGKRSRPCARPPIRRLDAEADDRCHVLGTGTQSTLMTTAGDQWFQFHTLVDDQRGRAFRCASLCAENVSVHARRR